MKIYFFTFLVALLVFSCKNSNSTDTDYAYFGGEIINPSNNYITLNNSFVGKDTIYLDKNNRFLHKIDSLKPGLYSFTHGGEFQTILLEPNDSLLFRLNTNDFDESLVYTGKGSKKNNYLIKSFLDNEIENKEFMNTSLLEPEVFVEHMDLLRKQKLAHFEEFLSKKPSSDLFKNIITSSINYNHYAYHEMFPFGYYGNKKLIHFKDLPEGFYDYRNEIDLNNESISELYAYNRFLFWHFNNIALKQYYKDGIHEAFDRMALDYNIEKLRLIDSSITSKKIKNYLLKHNIRNFILNSDNRDATIELINFYLKKSTNPEDKIYLKALVEAANKLTAGHDLPDATLIDYQGNSIELSSLINSPTVIYCWSTNFKMHSRNSHYKIRELQAKFPKVNFIAINFNDNDFNYWKKTLRSLKFSAKNEFKFSNPTEAVEKYVITFNHKTLVLDEHMGIISSNVGLFSDDMAESLKKVSNAYKSSSLK
ncbi:TlpA family protein disulfide reductase [Psychroserpens ponticola]|uniref:Redoxin domain-containing protein n=1 Tax=Psychroserpens ponticola TaxID=2932268 RepID=A0ABY7RXN7_9FLAO|nr:redoxin domain-containing protein [Psychroserpens ponticola]WCO00465.1 redoxin domain-containing protein [Psychroserpens ponticola]